MRLDLFNIIKNGSIEYKIKTSKVNGVFTSNVIPNHGTPLHKRYNSRREAVRGHFELVDKLKGKG